MLHAMGQLTDHLIPVIDVEKSEEKEVMNLSKKNVAGAGTNKRKELHDTTSANNLRDDCINSLEDVSLHAFLVCFDACQEENEPYVNFVVLLKVAVEDDILSYLLQCCQQVLHFLELLVYECLIVGHVCQVWCSSPGAKCPREAPFSQCCILDGSDCWICSKWARPTGFGLF